MLSDLLTLISSVSVWISFLRTSYIYIHIWIIKTTRLKPIYMYNGGFLVTWRHQQRPLRTHWLAWYCDKETGACLKSFTVFVQKLRLSIIIKCTPLAKKNVYMQCMLVTKILGTPWILRAIVHACSSSLYDKPAIVPLSLWKNFVNSYEIVLNFAIDQGPANQRKERFIDQNITLLYIIL